MIEKDKLPDFVKVIADDYLSLLLPHSSYDYLVLLTFYGASKIICANRVTIENKKIKSNSTCPNVYMMFIADSGTGKDKSKKFLKGLMEDYYLNFKKTAEEIRNKKLQEVEKYIELNNLNKSRAADYRDQNSPRFLYPEIDSRATNEGVMESRVALQIAEYGCSYWEDSELYDALPFLIKKNHDFIAHFYDVFDLGNSQAKNIKSNKNIQNIVGVPHLAALHGSVDESVDQSVFKYFFDKGYARRGFLFFENRKEYKRINNRGDLAEKALKNESYCKSLFKELDERTRQTPQITYPHNCKKIFLEKELEDVYLNYDEDCNFQASKINQAGLKGINNEITGRPWKALKLAGIIAIMEDSKNKDGFLITKNIWNIATYIVEYYAKYFAKFYGLSTESLEEKLARIIIENEEMSKSNIIKSLGGNGKNYNQVRSMVNTLLKGGALQEYLDSKDMILIQENSKFHKNSKIYKIEKIPEHGSETSCDQIEVEFSQGETNRDNDTAMYHTAAKFHELHLETKKPVKYSPAIFKDNYRKKANWLGGDQMIVFDFDNECKEESQATIDHIQTRFKDFTHLIATTRNHNKDKKGHGVRQRFRLFLPLSSPLNIKAEEYSNLMEKIAKKMFIDVSGWVDLPAAKDVARVYSGNPNQEHFYNDGRLMSWEVYNRTVDLRSFDEKQPKNAIDEHVILEVKGQPLGLHQAVELAKMKGKVPCKAYCHEDKAPSAFFCINNNGNFQYYCSSCGISKFYNL